MITARIERIDLETGVVEPGVITVIPPLTRVAIQMRPSASSASESKR